MKIPWFNGSVSFQPTLNCHEIVVVTICFVLNITTSFSTSFRSNLLAIMFQYTNLQGIQISAYKILVILQGKENQLVTSYSLKCWVVGAEWEQTLLS